MPFDDLKAYYRERYDSHDPWGSNISFWFDVCEVLHARGADIPAHWEYKPGLCSDITDEFITEFKTADLVKLGNLLCRFDALCRRLELNY